MVEHPLRTAIGQLHKVGSHQREETVAQVSDQVFREGTRITPIVHGFRNRGDSTAAVALDQRFDQFIQWLSVGGDPTRSYDLLEGRKGVSGRAATLPDHGVDGIVAHRQASVLDDPAHVGAQHIGADQVELQLLAAAANRLGHLLRVSRREYENDVRRRFLQCLQQRSLGRLGEHVHLVEDVHLEAPGRTEHGLFDEVAHGIHAVVAGRVEFVHVVTGTGLNGQAAHTFTTRLTVLHIGAVQYLGENAR